MSRKRNRSKSAPKLDGPTAPPDLVAALLNDRGGPAAEAIARAQADLPAKRSSRGRASQRAELVSDILAQLEAEEDAVHAPGSRPQRRLPWRRVSFNLPDTLMMEVRRATASLVHPPEASTLSRFAERALRRELDRLRRQRPSR